jgi:hypothetical protein
MPVTKKSSKAKGSDAKASSKGAQLDVIFNGPLLFVPSVKDGNVTEVEVYSPRNGHPMGAVFLPGVWFTDAELDDPQSARWPEAESFSLLDPHSYAVEVTQRSKKPVPPFPVTSIPATNHKIRPGRRLSHEWDVVISVKGWLSGWGSHSLMDVTGGVYGGSDAPMTDLVARTHRLSYKGVTHAEFCGAAKEHCEYLRSNISQGGSLLIQGEVPYHASLLHEREAVSSLAKLAGLDLHLLTVAPTARRTHVMNHVSSPCVNSVILTD